MNPLQFIQGHLWLWIPLLIWSLAWKGAALWRAARREQKQWFIALLIINTLGILEILYLFVFTKREVPNVTANA